MEEPFALIDRLRRAASLAARAEEGERNAGDALAQGLGRAQLHEIHAFLQEEAASAAGFAIGCVLVASARPILWLRTEAAERQGGRLHGPGLIAMGLDPQELVVGVVADDSALLRAAAARHATVCATQHAKMPQVKTARVRQAAAARAFKAAKEAHDGFPVPRTMDLGATMASCAKRVYASGTERHKTRVLLCHVYHHALHGHYQVARDQLLLGSGSGLGLG